MSAKALGILARKLHAPEVVGEILAGVLIGPAVLGFVSETDFISKMAEIGVIMLMFEAGLATDMKKLKQTGLKATAIACAGVFVPIVLGTILFMSFYGFDTIGSEQFYKALFIGTIMSATSVSITVAALKELGRLNGTPRDIRTRPRAPIRRSRRLPAPARGSGSSIARSAAILSRTRSKRCRSTPTRTESIGP